MSEAPTASVAALERPRQLRAKMVDTDQSDIGVLVLSARGESERLFNAIGDRAEWWRGQQGWRRRVACSGQETIRRL